MFEKPIFESYVFLEQINTLIKKNLCKFKRVNIIININDNNRKEIENIINFAKKNCFPFYIKNSYQKSVKYKANGIYLETKNKKVIRPLLLKKNFKIIGSVHNQFEYYQKMRQNCSNLTFSPLFFNEKYSKNKILGIIKFNLITLNWKTNISALGGISLNNLKKIKITSANSFSFHKLIYDNKIKKPAHSLRSGQD